MSKPIQVLMLGDHGHHRPADLAKVLTPVLAKAADRAVTYTDDVAALNPQNLAKYDCLLFYLNTTELPPANEAALMEFVEQGKGLFALHCASFAFLNSAKYLHLVGGRFHSHDTGVFRDAHHGRPASRNAWREQFRELGRNLRSQRSGRRHPRSDGSTARWHV